MNAAAWHTAIEYPASLELLPRDHVDLRQVARDVPDLFEEDFQRFIDQLADAGEKHQGVGIAAPQVGVRQRVFIMASKPNPRYPDAPLMVPQAIINPRILWRDTERVTDWEGCLSVPGLRGRVPRHAGIGVTYYDRIGVLHRQTFTGFLARLFQHEYDHLEGVLYPDRMQGNEKTVTLDEFAAITGKSMAGKSIAGN